MKTYNVGMVGASKSFLVTMIKLYYVMKLIMSYKINMINYCGLGWDVSNKWCKLGKRGESPLPHLQANLQQYITMSMAHQPC